MCRCRQSTGRVPNSDRGTCARPRPPLRSGFAGDRSRSGASSRVPERAVQELPASLIDPAKAGRYEPFVPLSSQHLPPHIAERARIRYFGDPENLTLVRGVVVGHAQRPLPGLQEPRLRLSVSRCKFCVAVPPGVPVRSSPARSGSDATLTGAGPGSRRHSPVPLASTRVRRRSARRDTRCSGPDSPTARKRIKCGSVELRSRSMAGW